MAHKIEEVAKVYLQLNEDGTGWEIDPVTCDGSPLFGYDNGPIDDECMCGRSTSVEHMALIGRAEAMDLPTAEELLHLLAEELGYTVTKEGTK